ncbi:MAG: hypothetical protein IKW46_01465 [Bacteroidaceae bacterium]|nr:hypothetical protein [Bacteroidaceae bacterium]
MKNRVNRLIYFSSTALFGLLALLFLAVLITSLAKNTIDMWVRIGWSWKHAGNYVGLIAGFATYILLATTRSIFRISHNQNWFMKFTHELTHTLVALLFFKKINEFVVRGRECYVNYKVGKYGIGYVPITLSPYCIPIYTFMIFPFRFAGDNNYMIFFDALIAFTYAFHIHAFIKQTRFTQPDIENCGIARSVTFLTFTHLTVASLILATPKGGVLKALGRVFWEYPWHIITDPVGWASEIIKYF